VPPPTAARPCGPGARGRQAPAPPDSKIAERLVRCRACRASSRFPRHGTTGHSRPQLSICHQHRVCRRPAAVTNAVRQARAMLHRLGHAGGPHRPSGVAAAFRVGQLGHSAPSPRNHSGSSDFGGIRSQNRIAETAPARPSQPCRAQQSCALVKGSPRRVCIRSIDGRMAGRCQIASRAHRFAAKAGGRINHVHGFSHAPTVQKGRRPASAPHRRAQGVVTRNGAKRAHLSAQCTSALRKSQNTGHPI